ncbi:hypothetical protein P43SY_001314 [Pythium insidiosum]|uniref:Uncharacterized protein n=1 Tax=Pythium insidiosum TaxID=114742 RepID=A0AAD5LHK8_PYTIN|nr:hypothetical protein P43SY_001314 [Pythium insidiosum]
MTRSVWRSSRHEDWDAQWCRYDDAVAAHQEASKKDALVELDRWHRGTLRAVLHERDPAPFMTQQELKKLMEWKLKKGKWRPQLMKFVTSLGDAEVKAASKAALKVVRDGLSASTTKPKTLTPSQLKAAIEALTSLKGVGPATASAVLAAYSDSVPFMGDEALEALASEIGARKYTLPHYVALAESLQAKADWLNTEKKESDDPWTPQRVQLCLYAEVFAPCGGDATKTETAKKAAPKKTKAPSKRSLEDLATDNPYANQAAKEDEESEAPGHAPRARRIKASSSSATGKPQPPTVLPRLGSNNNHSASNEQLSAASSPHVRAIPLTLPIAPRPPAVASKPGSSASVPKSQERASGATSSTAATAKSAWTTPRSPTTSDVASLVSPTTSQLTSFFASLRSSPASSTPTAHETTPSDDDGVRQPSVFETPARLKSVEAALLATDEQYRIDMHELIAEHDKFLAVAATAAQHVDSLQSELLPAVAESAATTRAALQSLARDITTLHEDHATSQRQMTDHFDAVFSQQTDERVALVNAHLAERDAMLQAHEEEVNELQQRAAKRIAELEKNATDRITQIEQQTAQRVAALQEESRSRENDLQTRLGEQSVTSGEALRVARAVAALELEDLRSRAVGERLSREASVTREIAELKRTASDELEALRAATTAAYAELETTSRAEYSALKSAANQELDNLRQVSAQELNEVSSQLQNELREARERARSELEALETASSTERDRLRMQWQDDVTRLEREHSAELNAIHSAHDAERSALEATLAMTTRDYEAKIDALTRQFKAEQFALETHAMEERKALTQQHHDDVTRLQHAAHTAMEQVLAQHQATVASLQQEHDTERAQERERHASTCESMRVTHAAELQDLRDIHRRECDTLTLEYETQLETVRRETRETMEQQTAQHDGRVTQMRDSHAARVLALETTIRELERQHSEAYTVLQTTYDAKREEAASLLEALTTRTAERDTTIERLRESEARVGLALEEWRAQRLQWLALDQNATARYGALREELRQSNDDRQVKAQTILELTFVVQSRDDEVASLRRALLETTQHVNTKNEMLALTAESLSTTTKELEATRQALRVESGRLSRVEEEKNHRDTLLEDHSLKMETLRAHLDAQRTEVKRLTMELQLQHEHMAREVELKQGELRRLYAAQHELKTRNDAQQETILRLEDSLAMTQREGDEARRRVELLKLEASQRATELSAVREELLAQEKSCLELSDALRGAQRDAQRLQIAVNDLGVVVQRQRESAEQLKHAEMCQREASEASIMDREDRIQRVMETHLQRVSELRGAWQQEVASLRGERGQVADELQETSSKLRLSTETANRLETKVQDLEQSCRSLEDTIRVRDATIDNVRKEMALLRELHDAERHELDAERQRLLVLDDARLALWTQHVETFSQERCGVPSLRQDAPGGDQLTQDISFRSEADVLRVLCDAVRMRCLLRSGDFSSSPRVLTVDEVITSIRALEMTRRHVLRANEERVHADAVAERLIDAVNALTQLRSCVSEVGGGMSSPSDVPTADADAFVTRVRALHPLVQALPPTEVSIEENSITWLEQRVALAIAALRDHDHARNVLEVDCEGPSLLRERRELLATARAVMHNEAIQTIADLKASVFGDLGHLRDTYVVINRQQQDSKHRDTSMTSMSMLRSASMRQLESSLSPASEETCKLDTAPLSLSAVATLMAEQHALFVACQHALDDINEEESGSSKSSSLWTPMEIVEGIHALLRVVRRFETLQSTAAPSHRGFAGLEGRITTILVFLDELRLISQFAQSVLEQEETPSAAPSHTSSLASLLALSRSHTPELPMDSVALPPHDASSIEGHVGKTADEETSENDSEMAALVLSDDALLNPEGNVEGCGALSDSLLDISLVMNDHQRVLNEAARWVHKVSNLSPRRQARPSPENEDDLEAHGDNDASKQHTTVTDMCSEIGRIVREHCNLLSLARRLFSLQDPSRDLVTLLQCLAIVTRSTEQLAIQRKNSVSRSLFSMEDDQDATMTTQELGRSGALDAARHDVEALASVIAFLRRTLPLDSTVAADDVDALMASVSDMLAQSWTIIQERDSLREELSDLGQLLLQVHRTEAPAASRRLIFETLLAGQNALIDEKMDLEVQQQRETAEIQRLGLDIDASISRLDMALRLREALELREQMSAFATADSQRRELEEQRRLESEAAEAVATEIESTLKQRIETLRRDHESELQTLKDRHQAAMDQQREEHAFATEAAIAAALEKQAHQLEFRNTVRSVLPLEAERTDGTGHARLLEAVTRRDNAAVARIYRLIRLTTDVLNTSALSASTSGTTPGEMSVELTQAVMACVKELKALKDYMISSLEELTKPSDSQSSEHCTSFWALAVTSSDAAAVSDKETSIDAMLAVHREVMAWLHASQLSQTSTVTQILRTLAASLEMHAVGLPEGAKQVGTLEMALAVERAERAALQLQLETKETFSQRLEDAWNTMEATLRRALENAKQEREELQKRLNTATEQLAGVAMVQSLMTSLPSTSSPSGVPRTPGLLSNAAPSVVAAVPTRPDKPRGYSRAGLGSAAGASGTAHKERFVSDLEHETGQRRSSTAMRRAQEWKRHEILSSSLQLEREFRAATSNDADRLELSPSSPVLEPLRSGQASVSSGSGSVMQDNELWYQGVRTLQHVQFFISAFFVARQNMFRIEAFNSDTEQAQTIYVTLDEMERFVRESRRAEKLGLSLEDPTKRSEVIDVVLFGRVKVLGGGEGSNSNLLLAFE